MQRTVIDVREPSEFMAGHVDGALNIPVADLPTSSVIRNLDKNTPIVVYCRSGARAAMAANFLKSLGFSNVTNGINQTSLENA